MVRMRFITCSTSVSFLEITLQRLRREHRFTRSTSDGRTSSNDGRKEAMSTRDTPEHIEIVPCELSEANEFVRRHHRHHHPVVGHKFALACATNGEVHGVAIVGRPVARMLQDGETLEVVRVATDGFKNACSALYAASWRAARAMGYRRL